MEARIAQYKDFQETADKSDGLAVAAVFIQASCDIVNDSRLSAPYPTADMTLFD